MLTAAAASGLQEVVFSGGEPTLSEKLEPLVDVAYRLGLRTTLSTNGIRSNVIDRLVDQLSDVGIPIDGVDEQTNDVMRRGSLRFAGWSKAVRAVVSVQRISPETAVTVRTVLAKPNLAYAADIPFALESEGVILDAIRFKLYQVEPFGPHVAQTDFDSDWSISKAEAQNAALAFRNEAGGALVELQTYDRTVGRYFLVDPDGEATGTDEDSNGAPTEIHYGNVIADRESAFERFRDHKRKLEERRKLMGDRLIA